MHCYHARYECDDSQLYYRHNALDASRPALLFIHGIGESGFCFLEAFQTSLADDFNIIVPDLAGFGLSSAAVNHGYGFEQQIARLRDLLESLGVTRIHLVGHSMGGDVGTLFCQHYADQVLSFVNIEGDLTPDNRFIVGQAQQALAEGRFEQWLRQDFAGKQIVELCSLWPSTVRYLASLNLCRSDAFLQSAQAIDKLLTPSADAPDAPVGRIYRELDIARVYCWGSDSLSQSAREFLDENKLRNRAFADAFHWVMLDQPRLFYAFLSEFLQSQG